MFTINQPITPAAKSHLDAQLSFLNDMSKTAFHSIQKISELNLQVAQTVMEESAQACREIMSAQKPAEILSLSAAQAQPAAEKMRAYQQHLAQIAADTQVDWARCAEQHVQETSRTAKALSDEVVKTATEETEKARQRQQEAIGKFTDPIKTFHSGNGNAQAEPGVMHSGAAQTGAAGGKQVVSPRKDA
jgi:phasin family protein